MDNGNNFDFASTNYFDFIDNLNAEGHQWPGELEPCHTSTAASSSGDELPMYSSSEGELEHGYSIYSDQNNLSIESDADMNGTGYYSDMSLPILRIPTSSPPDSPASARSPSVDDEIYNLLLISKRPRSPVAADLDTANILPMEHRRKRIRPARVRE